MFGTTPRDPIASAERRLLVDAIAVVIVLVLSFGWAALGTQVAPTDLTETARSISN